MRLFEYFKILFGRKKPKLAKNEDVVYGQFRQVFIKRILNLSVPRPH